MMATRGPRFSAIPGIPQSGLTDWQFGTLNSMKENLELLIGARGTDASVRAVLRGQVTVDNPPAQTMTRVSASGAGFTIGNATVPSLDDYNRLVLDVQALASDVAALRATVSVLINQLKG
jgi:hypothetical protein